LPNRRISAFLPPEKLFKQNGRVAVHFAKFMACQTSDPVISTLFMFFSYAHHIFLVHLDDTARFDTSVGFVAQTE
jgi:hypothetical protein